MKKKDAYEKSVFKDADDYYAFAKKHNVFGSEAIKLKKKLDQLYAIPEPKVKPK